MTMIVALSLHFRMLDWSIFVATGLPLNFLKTVPKHFSFFQHILVSSYLQHKHVTHLYSFPPTNPYKHSSDNMVEWNEANERLLLLAVLDHERRGNWQQVADILGDGFSASAIR